MKLPKQWLLAILPIIANVCIADSNSSHQILSSFRPPQVFRNTNLIQNINLEKSFVRTIVNVVIENTDGKPQDEYYIPFDGEAIGKVGGLEVRDKKDAGKPAFKSELVEYDTYSSTQFYRITLPTPLAPSASQTLSISYHVLSSLFPLPVSINQQDKQYLLYKFSAYFPSAYPTLKQRTKIKFSTTDIPDYTTSDSFPERQGSTFTYGPYEDIPAGASQDASVRYEFTKPIIHATLLERDIEVSHWGGNLATEERYWLTNKGAALANNFNRVTWASAQYYNPPTSAIKALNVPLKVGSLNPYFVDDIGNVSTSRFRSNIREANLELKPRYPVFGKWNYSFKIGWDASLRNFLRGTKGGDGGYILKVPFLEGPKMAEGMSYEKVELRIILPEGASNVKFETDVPIVAEESSLHRTFMDTLGRTTLKLTAMNLVDESRDEMIIVTYDYPFAIRFRKPVTIFIGALGVFVAAYAVSKLDVSIGKKKTA
ncbi:dolichyl-diphosphooligosaccharide--protein glycosyltransferase subunit 1 [Bachmanniomyces sp. S44760]|nr:dolichyl-diphosphooligosaccharide--protein glycosyltransferase subunit 1 [Bachmanniomyces sp. S44760]